MIFALACERYQCTHLWVLWAQVELVGLANEEHKKELEAAQLLIAELKAKAQVAP